MLFSRKSGVNGLLINIINLVIIHVYELIFLGGKRVTMLLQLKIISVLVFLVPEILFSPTIQNTGGLTRCSKRENRVLEYLPQKRNHHNYMHQNHDSNALMDMCDALLKVGK